MHRHGAKPGENRVDFAGRAQRERGGKVRRSDPLFKLAVTELRDAPGLGNEAPGDGGVFKKSASVNMLGE